MKRRMSAGLLAAGILLAVAGCSQPIPQASPDPVPSSPPPVVLQVQTDRIISELAADVEAGDKASNTELLTPRVTGPALRMRGAQYLGVAQGEELMPLGFDVAGLMVTDSDQWPRFFVAVASPPDGAQAGRMYVLVQQAPQQQYQMWSWMRLMPGITLPPTNPPEVGSPVVAMDDTSVQVPPGQVIEDFIDVLANGDSSKFASAFADTPLKDTLAEAKQSWSQIASAVGGTVTQSYTPSEEGTYALATGDGGAIVFGAMRGDTEISLPGGKIKVPAQWAGIIGMTEASAVQVGADITVAFYIPPAGSSAQIQVLGAENVVVTGSGTPAS